MNSEIAFIVGIGHDEQEYNCQRRPVYRGVPVSPRGLPQG